VPLEVFFGHGQTTSTDVGQAFLQLVLEGTPIVLSRPLVYLIIIRRNRGHLLSNYIEASQI